MSESPFIRPGTVLEHEGKVFAVIRDPIKGFAPCIEPTKAETTGDLAVCLVPISARVLGQTDPQPALSIWRAFSLKVREGIKREIREKAIRDATREKRDATREKRDATREKKLAEKKPLG